MRECIIREILHLLKQNKDLHFITADLGFGLLDELEKQLPNQFTNVGVAEQNMIGVAAGMALTGKKIFCYSLGNFPTMRCLEQIRNNILYHDLDVILISSGAGFSYGPLGMSHHLTEDIGYMRSLPNIRIFSPGSEKEATEVLHYACTTKGPAYIRVDKSAFEEELYESLSVFNPERPRLLASGEDIAILSYGGLLKEVANAKKLLAKENLIISVYSFPQIKPIDENFLQSILKQYTKLLVVEEHNKYGGLGSVVSEVLVKKKCTNIDFSHLSIPDEYPEIVGDQNFLRELYGLSTENIVKEIKKLL